MEPSAVPETVPDGAFSGKFSGTRRSFIRGVAAAGASTALASTFGSGGALFTATARAARPTRFSDFTAIAPSADDAFQVPPGYRADVIIGYGDKFADDKGNVFTYGYNCDFLAFFPLDRRGREGLLFINHEYTSPFFLHGYKPEGALPGGASNPNFKGKSRAQIDQERATIGNAIVHVRQDRGGVWSVVSPSKYNRRIYAGDVPGQPATHYSLFAVTGPLRGDPRIGTEIWGTLGNCSGGTTPWGTAISCEENFDGYGLPLPSTQDFVNGWADPTNDGFPGYPDYNPGRGYRADGPDNRKYGWVCEHDPYDPSFQPRKHTALGRFRHENTAFRHVPGKQFVIYMGDDANSEAIYKFVSEREFKRGRRSHNLKILEEGTLYVARWEPEGRRRFANPGDTQPLTPTSGTGTWESVPVEGLSDTRGYLSKYGNRLDLNSENGRHYATNRPEDVEVGPDGAVYITFTNNTARFTDTPPPSPSAVNDSHGAVRRLVEAGNDPTAMKFTWEDFAAGGPPPGGDGFSSPDNLVFDSKGNLWVVTDISTGSINTGVYDFHDNNAVFMIPTRGPNAGVAFRFANMPIQAEGTGPYFTPDEKTLFVNVQHPGENSGILGSPSQFGVPSTYTSYWPHGNKTLEQNPSEPIPSTVAVTRVAKGRGHDGDSDSDSDSDRGHGRGDRDSDSDSD